MIFIDAKELKRYNQFYPNTVVLIGVNHQGCTNIMPSSWHTALSRDPILYGISISPERYTHDLLMKAQAFSLNFVPADQLDLILQTGRVSGRNEDKLRQYAIPYNLGRLTQTPILRNAYCAYECKLQQVVPTGDHDWVVGEVVGIHLQDVFSSENGVINLTQAKVPLYMGAYTYRILDDKADIIVAQETKADGRTR